MSIGFVSTVKPYFTACYRAHMIRYKHLDLWDAEAVQAKFDAIHQQVSDGGMPMAGCPEGVWDQLTRQQFLSDLKAWKAAGFPP
jgi:hypothetical protein